MEEKTVEAGLNLVPDAWKYKEGSDYSVTEGMEYETFTKEFRNLYERIKEKDVQAMKELEANVFMEDFSIRAEDENIKAGMFAEVHRGLKREEAESGKTQWEFLSCIGLLVVLFLILARFTFRKKVVKRHGGFYTGNGQK